MVETFDRITTTGKVIEMVSKKEYDQLQDDHDIAKKVIEGMERDNKILINDMNKLVYKHTKLQNWVTKLVGMIIASHTKIGDIINDIPD